MAKLSAGQKRRQKELKRKKKKQLQVKKNQQPSLVYRSTLPGLPKLSERLLEFAGDLLGASDTNQHSTNNAVSLAVMCWNMGVVTADTAAEMRTAAAQIFEENADYLSEELEDHIDLLITKKRFIYGDDPRLIVDYSVNWGQGSQYHLQVHSAILPEEERFIPNLENSSLGMSDKTRHRMSALANPVTDQEKDIEQQIENGFSLLKEQKASEDKDPSVAACEAWLEAWEMIKTQYKEHSAFKDINNRLGAILNFWSADMDLHLLNAAIAEPAFSEKGLTFLREFLTQFPDSHEGLQASYRCAIAELQFRMGANNEGEATFAALTKDFPDYTWGYLAWGDVYNPTNSPSLYPGTPADIDRAKRLYRTPIIQELEDIDDARERLEELQAYEQEATTVLDT